MSEKLKIVIPTKLYEHEYKKTQQWANLESLLWYYEKKSIPIEVEIVAGNSKGLSELYQTKLEDSVRECDYILFMHDDLEIHDHFLYEKLIKAHETYDIVGLAGATSQDYTRNIPPVWHLSKIRQGDARGVVGHLIPKGFQNTSETHVNSAYFGPTPGKVVVIDGLFMSFKISSVKNTPTLFNSKYTFHHYDMAMCLNAHGYGLDIGVWPIYCVHHGLGEFDTDPLWQTLSKEFKKDYGDKVIKV